MVTKSSKSSNMPPGRNEKCPCGSGRKYKLCCGDPKRVSSDSTTAETAVPAVHGEAAGGHHWETLLEEYRTGLTQSCKGNTVDAHQ